MHACLVQKAHLSVWPPCLTFVMPFDVTNACKTNECILNYFRLLMTRWHAMLNFWLLRIRGRSTSTKPSSKSDVSTSGLCFRYSIWMPEKTPGRVRFSQVLHFTTNHHLLYLWLSLSGPLGGGWSRSCQDSSVLLLCLSSFPQVPLHGRSRPSARRCHRFTRPGQLLLWAGGVNNSI